MEHTQTAMTATRLKNLATPCLVLDADRMERNITRLRHRLDGQGVALRPHLKTAKSVEVARRVMSSPAGPATVSTLKEAEQFVAAGVRDIIYAVGIVPTKLPQVLALRAKGADVAVVLDTVEQPQAVARASRDAGTRIPALIEIDCDGHRSGVRPDDRQRLIDIGRALADGAELRGVLPELVIGDRVRILPNHACATAAQHGHYHVVRGSSSKVEAQWPRFGGWQ